MATDSEWIHKPLKFKRKVNLVEAVQIKADNIHEVARWCGGKVKFERESWMHSLNNLLYPSLSGGGTVGIDQWLIKDEQGVFSHMSDSDFKAKFSYHKDATWKNT